MRGARAVVFVVVAALVLASAAVAKDFRPGDLRICNAKRCVAITNQPVLNTFAAFYYGRPQPTKVAAPAFRAPYFELRFTNGYATGIVATPRLDRFLSYGVNLDQFRRGRWYRVPAAAARELRKLTVALRPLPLTRAAIARSH